MFFKQSPYRMEALRSDNVTYNSYRTKVTQKATRREPKRIHTQNGERETGKPRNGKEKENEKRFYYYRDELRSNLEIIK